MKKLLIIDPHFISGSPAMKSLYRSTEFLAANGYEVEVWCLDSDSHDEHLNIRTFPHPIKIWYFESIWFWICAHFRWWKDFELSEKKRPEISIVTSFYCVFADVSYIHFLFEAYAECCRRHRDVMHQPLIRRIQLLTARIQEFFLWRSGGCREWWVVSEAIGDYARKHGGEDRLIKVLPNSYDDSRFNIKERKRFRDTKRQELALTPEDLVFCFVGLGDFERKGAGLALAIADKLRQHPSLAKKTVKLLIVGGKSEIPTDITEIARKYGVRNLEFLIQEGRVADIRPFLAASDALLFPSFFEAFALVEIEAAAMGLRLYLTPHFGSEMIVGKGGNGKIIPWTVDEAVEIIAGDISTAGESPNANAMGDAVSLDGYQARLLEFLNAFEPRVPIYPEVDLK